MTVATVATAGGVTTQAAGRSSFVRLCIIGFLAYCSYAICRTPLLPMLARELGATAPMVGVVVGASTLTGILVKLPAGAWSDVLGRRPLLVSGAVVFATLPFTYLGVASLGALLSLRFLHGAATAIFGPVASAGLSDIAPAERRGAWLSTYSAVQGAGQAIGPVIAGYLIATGRYNLAFMAAGLIAAATPFLAAGWPRRARANASSRRRGQFRQVVREVLRQPLILMTSVAQAAQFVLHGTLSAFLPLFALDVIGLTPSQVGWLFALQTVTTLATRPLMGIMSDRLDRRSVIIAGLTVCSGAVWFVAQAAGPVTLSAAVLAYAVGVAVTAAATSAFITDLSHRTRYGAAHGVFGTIYDIGDAFGPIAAGLLVASVGYAHMFRVMAVVAFTVTAVFFVVSRRTDGPLPPDDMRTS